MSLQDFLNRIKPPQVETIQLDENGEVRSASWRIMIFQKLFLSLTIILVALLSFGIGRLSVAGDREPIKIEYDPNLSTSQVDNVASVISATKPNNSTSVVVSKNGTRYHYLDCAGAKQIKEENKIVFATPVAAEAAGYTLAANCKPR